MSAKRNREVAAIVEALDELLRAYDAAPPRKSGTKTYSGTELSVEFERRLSLSSAAKIAEDICDRPIGHSILRSMQALGSRLHELGGKKLMQDVLEEVAELQPSRQAWRSGVLDKRWHGIGEWVA